MFYLQQLLVFLLATNAASQQVDRICSCTPLVYKWNFDFSKACPPPNITIGETKGIKDAFCRITNGSSLMDFPPVVTYYQIIELDQTLSPIKVQSESNITLGDGDIISFTSITAAEPYVVSGGLQATVDALNSNNEKIVLEWIVRYSNVCDIYPYSHGNALGWMEILMEDDEALPRSETCSKGSEVPSLIPSNSPVSMPTSGPTSRPTRLLTALPSLRPSTRPSAFPTLTLTEHPTDLQTNLPTTIDSEKPSYIPSTMSMSYSYYYSMSMDYSSNLQNTNMEFGRTKLKDGRKR